MTKSASSSKQAPKPAGELPLFFKNPVPLDLKRHSKAGLLPVQDLSYAATTNSILINAVEFFEASKHYPIVFIQSEMPMPTVVVGLEQKNYFVNDKGMWKEGAYLPAYVRKYPFVFMDMPERNEFLLCIDEGSAQYKENGGKDTVGFYRDNAPSEMTHNALEFCSAFQNHNRITAEFCEAIQKAGLLAPMRSDAKLNSGREIHLGGFQAIDEKKVNAMPEKTVLEFFKKGWLPLIYAALMSASNWKTLVDMAAGHEKAKAN